MEVIANWLWQGCCVALVAAVLLRGLDRASSQVRYLVCWVSVSVVLFQPLTSTRPFAPSPLPDLTLESPLNTPLASATDSVPWDAFLAALWGFWLLVHAWQVAVAVFANSRRRTRYAAFPPILESRLQHWTQVKRHGRRTRLVVSDDVRAAAVVGCGSPVIAIAPALVQQLTADELDRVVIHEWAHVQRRDDIANLTQLVAHAIAGWHPAVWWLERRLQAERETACDEMAVTLTGSAKAYATCLVKLASLAIERREAVPALGALSSSSLADRVRRIVSHRPDASRGWSRATATAAIALLIALSLSMGSLRFVEAVAVSEEIDEPRTLAPSTSGHMVIDPPASIVRASVRRARSQAPAPDPVTVGVRHQIVNETASQELPPAPSPDTPAARIEPDTSEHAPTTEALLPATSIPMSPPQQQISPWAAAANAGIALGQRSKNGGLATGAFFSRLGKRVADSF